MFDYAKLYADPYSYPTDADAHAATEPGTTLLSVALSLGTQLLRFRAAQPALWWLILLLLRLWLLWRVLLWLLRRLARVAQLAVACGAFVALVAFLLQARALFDDSQFT
jgi:hypothetical protein